MTSCVNPIFTEIAENLFRDLDLRSTENGIDVDGEEEEVIGPNTLTPFEHRDLITYGGGLLTIQQVLERAAKEDLQVITPFAQHAINAESHRLGVDTFVYSEEALKDRLAATWNGVKKTFALNKKVVSSVYDWMRTDGKGLVQNGIGQVKSIRNKRREVNDITVPAGLAHQIEEGASLYRVFQTLVDERYADYADHRNDAAKMLKRVRPGDTVIDTLGDSFSIADSNAALVGLDEQLKTTRDTLNKIKRKSRELNGAGKTLSSLVRDLDQLSTFLEEVVNFVEVLEKDTAQWEGDQARIERLYGNDKTVVKGAEGFIKMVSDQSTSDLLRFCTTLIKFIAGTISKAHRQMNSQQ